MSWWQVITIPIGAFGLLFKDEIRTGAGNLWLTATATGLALCLGLVPGVSRSGATMSASGPQLPLATIIAFVVGFAAVVWFLVLLGAAVVGLPETGAVSAS